MNEKFIYVFSIEDRERLLKIGFTPIQQDDKQDVYVFENNPDLFDELEGITFCPTSVLRF